MKKLIFTLLPLLAISAALPAQQIDRQVLFQRGENGVHTYRIPAIVQANDGTLP